MSVQRHFQDTETYFMSSLLFLHNCPWLYRTPNTHILIEDLLKYIPTEWLPVLCTIPRNELNKLPFGYINENWPLSFQDFLMKIESLKPIQNKVYPKLETDLPVQFFNGLSQKKLHEILTVAPYIHETCKKNNIKYIIDIGAGLGYLPQLLHKVYGYKILAIEADEQKVQTAIKRQKEMYNCSLYDVLYIQHFVDKNSGQFLEELIDNYYVERKKVCLIGLHACADLSCTLLDLFLEMRSVTQAIVMPCCYHRLSRYTEDSTPRASHLGRNFINFPASIALRHAYTILQASKLLTTAFMRLACQNTAAKWKTMSAADHKIHAIGAMRRNVLQLVAEREGYQLCRIKRKTHIAETEDFLTYLDGLKQTHKLTDPKRPAQEDLIASQEFRDKMIAAWKVHEKDWPLMQAFAALQTCLQSVCENIVLLDLVHKVKEMDYVCFAQKITDDSISPRCYAVVATKK